VGGPVAEATAFILEIRRIRGVVRDFGTEVEGLVFFVAIGFPSYSLR
jgi:hypothetical protein